jgi:hypothetical protein
MGLDGPSLRFLLHARPRLDRTLTVGRQALIASRGQVAALMRAHGMPAPASGDGFAEPVLRAMGAQTVDSLDISPFEGATVIHDLNQPLAEPPRRFTAVVDGGSLEHVFNFPVAMRTTMELVEPGGSLVIMVPANNEIGHGFYQFSPELFYRVLERGFDVRELLLHEYGLRPTWYRIADAKAMGRQRVTVRTRRSTYVMLHAVRTTDEPIPDLTPQQSDYERIWHGAAPAPRSLAVKVGDRVARRVTVLQGRIGTPELRRVKL